MSGGMIHAWGTDEQAEYVPVEDEEELEAVYGVFAQMLEDIDLEK